MVKSYQAYIIDLDGTMYLGDQPIEQAPAFIQALREKEKKFLFLTNNSTKVPADVCQKLKDCGVEAYEDEIYTSSMACLDYLLTKDVQTVYLIGEGGIEEAVRSSHIQIKQEGLVDAVVVGLDRHVTYEELAQASLMIQDGAELVVTNPDSGLPTDQGLIPGAGAISAFLETASQRPATVIGKPEAIMMNKAVEALEVDKAECLMVGDNYQTDIRAGLDNGIDSLMVFTGLTTKEEAAEMDRQPTYKVDDLSQWEIL